MKIKKTVFLNMNTLKLIFSLFILLSSLRPSIFITDQKTFLEIPSSYKHGFDTNTLGKLLKYVELFNSITSNLTDIEKHIYRDEHVKKLAELKLAQNESEFWQLLEAASNFDLTEISHALAQQYLQSHTANHSIQHTVGEKAYSYIRKQDFLLNKNEDAITPETSLTLKDVTCAIRPKILNAKINLSNLHLSSLEGIEIYSLAPVDQIDLQNNKLETIPAAIGMFTGLKNLNLANNRLKTLPEDVGNLTNLLRLDLENNQLEELPKNIGNLTSLWRLNLNKNKLSSLPESFCNLKNLNMLWLEDNLFGDQTISNLHSLRKLYRTNQ